ncbi:carbohydrate kinase [Pseudonocardia benzenivorans]|uniref:Fructokinase n=2 Tax=Pseudonocardia TaxID=1847 RepID=F4CND1_PSEUX|nr:carbohydrate kinase [Pseudonocardia dioxanivorans]AEA27155.1 Fructokinase [Pseudonocardia dioxanivorans CB1190]GJF07222.1 fructokinase [Pseudonocardia sp. D17]
MTTARAGIVAVAGEALVDIVPAPVDGYHELVPGGSPANTAVGLARLGVPVRMLARLADDPLGRRLRAHLARNGVDLSHVVAAAEPSSMALVEVDEQGVASYDFRVAGTADWQWTAAELAGALDGPVVAVHTGSLATTTPPGAAVLRDLVRRAAARATVSYDPNCRPLLMGDREDVLAGVHELVGLVDVVKVSSEDLEWLLPGMSPADVLDDWVARGAALVAVTLGADGVLAATAGGLRTRLPGRPVHVVDTVGAGDTFSAALLAGLHDAGLLGVDARPALRAIGPDVLHEVLDGAVRAAAITCSRRGADPPTAAELAAAH